MAGKCLLESCTVWNLKLRKCTGGVIILIACEFPSIYPYGAFECSFIFQIDIYTYNWSKERVENLHQQATQLGHWLSARSSLLTSIVTQKMGLFHNQEIARKQHITNVSADNGAMPETLTKSSKRKVKCCSVV